MAATLWPQRIAAYGARAGLPENVHFRDHDSVNDLAFYLEVFSLLVAEQLIDVIDRVMMMLMYVRACRQQLHHFDRAAHHALLERICEKTSFSLSKFPYVCPEPVLVK